MILLLTNRAVILAYIFHIVRITQVVGWLNFNGTQRFSY